MSPTDLGANSLQPLGEKPLSSQGRSSGMAEKPSCAVRPERLELGLAGLWERAVAASPVAAQAPVRDIAYGAMWVVARLEQSQKTPSVAAPGLMGCNPSHPAAPRAAIPGTAPEGGVCGRAFAFTGAHAVYGPFDLAALEALRELVGLPAAEAFARLTSPDAPARFGRLAQTVAVAVLNAVAAEGNRPQALAGRGWRLLDNVVETLVRPGDRVAVVGAGMFLRELAACDARVDVIDLRPACDLASAHVTAEGVEYLPRGLTFHGEGADTAALVAEADVLFLTGCTLVNDTFFELMALPRRAREVVLFGPSAGAPFEALVELGVTCVASSATLDADALVASTLGGLAARQTPREACASYVVALPGGSVPPVPQG